MTELRCGRDLALRLGALSPVNAEHHRQLRADGHLLIRDPVSGFPAFWPWQLPLAELSASSRA